MWFTSYPRTLSYPRALSYQNETARVTDWLAFSQGGVEVIDDLCPVGVFLESGMQEVGLGPVPKRGLVDRQRIRQGACCSIKAWMDAASEGRPSCSKSSLNRCTGCSM